MRSWFVIALFGALSLFAAVPSMASSASVDQTTITGAVFKPNHENKELGNAWEAPDGITWGETAVWNKGTRNETHLDTFDHVQKYCMRRSAEVPTENDIKKLRGYLFDKNGRSTWMLPNVAYRCSYGDRDEDCGWQFWTAEKKKVHILRTGTSPTMRDDLASVRCIIRRGKNYSVRGYERNENGYLIMKSTYMPDKDGSAILKDDYIKKYGLDDYQRFFQIGPYGPRASRFPSRSSGSEAYLRNTRGERVPIHDDPTGPYRGK